MKLLIVSLLWLSILMAYCVRRYLKRDRAKFNSWCKGFVDWWQGVNKEYDDQIGYYRSGHRRAAEVGYYLGWAGYGLLCLIIILSFRWAFA